MKKSINILKEPGMPFSFFSSFKAFKMLPVVFVFAMCVFAGWDLITPKPTENHINSIHFVNPSNGWFATSSSVTDTCEIFHTTDSGKIWIRQLAKSPGNVSSIFFINISYGWATSSYDGSKKIIKTTDGGANWNIQYEEEPSVSFKNIFFTDSNNGWFIGYVFNDSSMIYHTSDSGNTWNIQYSSQIYDFNSFFFINSTTGWVCADLPSGPGVIIKTNNGGVNWIRQYENNSTNDGLNDIYFVDANNGWAAGDDGLTVHTEDGGETWKRQDSGPSTTYDIHFTDRETGWQVGNEGKVVHTSDGGETWEAVILDTNRSYYDVYFTDHNHGWIVGGKGTIYRTTDGGGYPYPIINKFQTFSKNFTLNSFLNPATQSLTINFTLKKKDYISIGIYSVKGRLVKQLVDGFTEPGEHSVNWDVKGECVSAGTYIMRVRAGDSKVSRKVVIIK